MKKLKIKTLFLIDALGALASTIMLGGVLTYFEDFFGMPSNILYILAGIAFVFFIYSLSCYLFLKEHLPIFLRIIAVSNFVYVCVTLFFVFQYLNSLTIPGILYFAGEAAIIAAIVTLEWYNSSEK